MTLLRVLTHCSTNSPRRRVALKNRRDCQIADFNLPSQVITTQFCLWVCFFSLSSASFPANNVRFELQGYVPSRPDSRAGCNKQTLLAHTLCFAWTAAALNAQAQQAPRGSTLFLWMACDFASPPVSTASACGLLGTVCLWSVHGLAPQGQYMWWWGGLSTTWIHWCLANLQAHSCACRAILFSSTWPLSSGTVCPQTLFGHTSPIQNPSSGGSIHVQLVCSWPVCTLYDQNMLVCACSRTIDTAGVGGIHAHHTDICFILRTESFWIWLQLHSLFS